MDPSLAASMLLARHKADVAMAVAARMQEMNPKAAAHLLEAVSDSADELERVASELVKGTGELLDTMV